MMVEKGFEDVFELHRKKINSFSQKLVLIKNPYCLSLIFVLFFPRYYDKYCWEILFDLSRVQSRSNFSTETTINV